MRSQKRPCIQTMPLPLTHFLLICQALLLGAAGVGIVAGIPGLVPNENALVAQKGEKEYSQIESPKIKAACGLTDAQWATCLPDVNTQLLEEGHTTS
jgi:hypothetical protein